MHAAGLSQHSRSTEGNSQRSCACVGGSECSGGGAACLLELATCLLAPCLCNQPHLQCADCLCCTPPASHSKAGRRRAATAFAVRPRQSRHSHLHERHVVGSSAAREYERPGSLEAAALAAGHRRLACEGKPVEALTATLAAREYEAIEALTPALAARRRRCLQHPMS